MEFGSQRELLRAKAATLLFVGTLVIVRKASDSH